jgi:hypothetical protein
MEMVAEEKRRGKEDRDEGGGQRQEKEDRD